MACLLIRLEQRATEDVQTHHTNMAPRIGFADDLGHGTVLRGGFGLSFFLSNYTSNASLKNQPIVSTYTGVSTTLAAGLPDPVAASATNPSGSIPDNISPDFRISYLEQFNLLVNTAAFQVQPVGTLSNERRNHIYGPHYGHLDTSLFKDFPLHNQGIAQFCVESFNLNNMPTFANPPTRNLQLGSGSGFGTLSATNGNYTPCVLQFLLKVQF